MTAAVIVGIVISEIARSDRQVKPWAAATMLDLDHVVRRGCTGLHHDLSGRCCICASSQNERQQASRHDRGKERPTTHKITSIVTITKSEFSRSIGAGNAMSGMPSWLWNRSQRHGIAEWQGDNITG